MIPAPFFWGLIFMAGSIFGLLAAFIITRNKRKSERIRHEQLTNNYREISQEVKKARRDLIQIKETASHIPNLVKTLTANLLPNALPSIAVRFTKMVFNASHVGFFVPIKGSTDYTMFSGYGFPKDWIDKVRLPCDEGILGMALQKKVVVIKKDLPVSHGQRVGKFSIEKAGITADLSAPVFNDSAIAGVLVVAGISVNIEKEKQYASTIADLFSIAYQKATLFESINSNLYSDHLTGVANRNYFTQRFEREVRGAKNYMQPLSFLFCDIDELKKINDTYGHVYGDTVIQKIAKTIKECTRSSDLVARYGGDEFVVVLAGINKEQATIYAENLREKVSSLEFMIPGQETAIGATISIGVSMFPLDGQTTEELIQSADNALYDAKKEGRNIVVLAKPQRLGDRQPMG